MQLLKSKNFITAVTELEKAVAIDSTYGEAYYVLGQTYLTLRDYLKAVVAFKRARKLGISREPIFIRMNKKAYISTISLMREQKFDEVISILEQIMVTTPDSLEQVVIDTVHATAKKARRNVWDTMGHCYIKLRSDERVTKGDRTARQAFTEKAQWAFERAIESENASEESEDTTELSSKLAPAYYYLCKIYYEADDFHRAIEAGHNAIRRGPQGYPPAESLLGDAYSKLGQVEEARAHYTAAMKDSRFKDYAKHQLQKLDAIAKQRERVDDIEEVEISAVDEPPPLSSDLTEDASKTQTAVAASEPQEPRREELKAFHTYAASEISRDRLDQIADMFGVRAQQVVSYRWGKAMAPKSDPKAGTTWYTVKHGSSPKYKTTTLWIDQAGEVVDRSEK